jgi:hypothetical protein
LRLILFRPMKHLTGITVVAILFLSACASQKENSNEQPSAYEPCQDSVKVIKSILGSDSPLLNKVKELNTRVCLSEEINSVQQLDAIMLLRDSLMNLLYQDTAITAYLEKMSTVPDTLIDDEFSRLGIQTLWAEGMCVGMSRAPFLEETIERVGDEPYILKNKILARVGNTLQGEYRYYTLDASIEILTLAEKFLAKYPDHPYVKDILEPFIESVIPFTDVHKVSEGEDYTGYIVSGLSWEQYPGGTEIMNHLYFVKNHKNSRFAEPVQNILQSMSALTEPDADTIYIVTVPEASKDKDVFSSTELNTRLHELPAAFFSTPTTLPYLWLGVPVAHTMNLPSDSGGTNVVLAYRFFDTKEPALKSLQGIQAQIPEAQILKYHVEKASQD